VSPLNKSRSSRNPLLCYVTDRHSLPGVAPEASLAALAQKIDEAALAGVDWIQIREKDLPARELAALARQALRSAAYASLVAGRSARILVNDRLDVALAEHADGVHLGEHSVPLQEAKRLALRTAPPASKAHDFLLGVSCHSLEAAQKAQAAGAHYIFFGPIFATPSKAAFGAPQGLERLEQVCRAVAIPVIAIGGVTLENAVSCISAGASGIAAIRLFQEARDIPQLISRLVP
jgi:thiamine-phosphate pyrophosphorylase